MYCFQCGKKIDDDSEFCIFCGQKLNSESSAPADEDPTSASNAFNGIATHVDDENSRQPKSTNTINTAENYDRTGGVAKSSQELTKQAKTTFLLVASITAMVALIFIASLIWQPKVIDDLIESTQTLSITPTMLPTSTHTPIERPVQQMLAAGKDYTLVLRPDGKVVCFGIYPENFEPEQWVDIVQIAGDDLNIAGIRSNGSVIVAGQNKNDIYDASTWTNVKQIDIGYEHVIAVTNEGTVLFAGTNYKNRFAGCTEWTDISQVLAGSDHVAAIRNDGTVIAIGYDADGRLETDAFEDCIDGDVAGGSTFAIGRNGNVFVTGKNFANEDAVQGWTNIIAISGGDRHTIGLKSDGTVIPAGDNAEGQCNVQGWTDMVAVCAGAFHTVGLRADGTVFAVGLHQDGQCDANGYNIYEN